MADEVKLRWDKVFQLVRINRMGAPRHEGEFTDLHTIETHVRHIQANEPNPIKWRVYTVDMLYSEQVSPGTNTKGAWQ
jgi:hypothetical protein